MLIWTTLLYTNDKQDQQTDAYKLKYIQQSPRRTERREKKREKTKIEKRLFGANVIAADTFDTKLRRSYPGSQLGSAALR